MIDLDLMQFKTVLKVKKENRKSWLFDPVRRKWLVLQPEEVVRQLVVQYLIGEKGYNLNRIRLEKSLKLNELDKRCDVLVYDAAVRPFLLVECKAPHVDITQDTFKQIAWYNMSLRVPYLLVTNGLVSFCCSIDHEKQAYEYLTEVPSCPES